MLNRSIQRSNGIETLESSLHRALKHHYSGGQGGRVEVSLGRDRVDAIDLEGRLVEVQCGPTSNLRPKITRFLSDYRVRVVIPVVISRRIIRREMRAGPDCSARLSPKRGTLFDAFETLVGLASMLPHPGLEVVIASVDVDELRPSTRSRERYRIYDRRLVRIVSENSLSEPADLRTLLPDGLPEPFTTREMASLSGRPEWAARRAAYCLRVSGSAMEVGRRGRFRSYRFPSVSMT